MIVDLFAGGGGASLAIQWATGRSPDLAVNHDPAAIRMHAANHPDTHHEGSVFSSIGCAQAWMTDNTHTRRIQE